MKRWLAGLVAILMWDASLAALPGRTLKVGPGQVLTKPSQAARVAKDGDIIEIAPVEYSGDTAVWRAHNLTLRSAPGGMATIRAAGAAAEGKAIWVIKGNDATVENIAFLEAQVKDRNGAGIRLEGRNLTVRQCLFRDNQNGILTGSNKDSELHVERSEFDHNGFGDGLSHNIYVGAIAKFTLHSSYSHRARMGHQVKSRAAENHILYNRLSDEESGHSSYLIDIPEAGTAYVIGNVLHQGPMAENNTLVSYGAEKQPHAANRLYFLHNTLVNDRKGDCRLLFVRPGVNKALVLNNLFVGCQRIDGPVLENGNIQAPHASLVSPRTYDFRPLPGSPAIDRGLPCTTLERLGLACPALQYLHPGLSEPRRLLGAAPDAGAFEASR